MMIALNEIEKTMFEFDEIAVENETDINCIFCRWYYTAGDEDIERCHFTGMTKNMPCYDDMEG